MTTHWDLDCPNPFCPCNGPQWPPDDPRWPRWCEQNPDRCRAEHDHEPWAGI